MTPCLRFMGTSFTVDDTPSRAFKCVVQFPYFALDAKYLFRTYMWYSLSNTI